MLAEGKREFDGLKVSSTNCTNFLFYLLNSKVLTVTNFVHCSTHWKYQQVEKIDPVKGDVR